MAATKASTRSESGKVRRVDRRGGRSRRADDGHQALRGGGPGRPLLAGPRQALALGVRPGRHQRERQHQGRGRLAAGAPRRDGCYGGDFLANQPPVKAMCDAAPSIVFMLDRMGVPFNRTPEGLLDFRRFGGTLFHRTAFAGATTGQQLLYALDEQVRRWETVDVEDEQGRARARARRWSASSSGWDFLALVLDDAGFCRGIVAQDLKTMAHQSLPGRRGVPGDRRLRHHLRQVDQQRHQHRHRGERRVPAGRLLRATASSSRSTPPRSPAPTSCASSPRACAARAAACGSRATPRSSAPAATCPRAAASTSSRRSTPATATWCRATSPAASSSRSASTRRRGVFNRESGHNENEVYLDVTHLPAETLRKKLAGVLEIYEKFVGEDPYTNPMRVFPAVHYSMGGLWVDFERAAQRLARRGLAAQPRDQHPGPLRGGRSRLPVPRRQPPRRQLAAVVHLGRA